MLSIIYNYKVLTVLQVFVIIISPVCAEKEPDPIDFYAPEVKQVNISYDGYHFEAYDRYDQYKLDPEDYFLSKYHNAYRALPKPHTVLNYNLYIKEHKEQEKNINLQEIEGWMLAAKEKENNPSVEERDQRYAYEDPDHYFKTNEKFYQSKLHETELKVATDYLSNDPVNKQPLSLEEYNNIMIIYNILPKKYEVGTDFIKARIKAALFIQATTPGLKKPVDESVLDASTVVPQLYSEDVLLKNESYEMYAMRMAYLGKIPLHPKTCNAKYNTEFPESPQRWNYFLN